MSYFTSLTAAAALALSVATPQIAKAQADPFLGQIMTAGYNFCPRGWAEAAGQLLPISSNSALFSLLGTQFGGNGVSTFALPDLRGRSIVGPGTGPGLAPVNIGQSGGQTSVTLTIPNMPSHSHTAVSTLRASEEIATTNEPSGAILAGGQNIYSSNPPDANLAALSLSTTVTATGGNQPFNVQNPYLGMITCIAIEGIFPSRS